MIHTLYGRGPFDHGSGASSYVLRSCCKWYLHLSKRQFISITSKPPSAARCMSIFLLVLGLLVCEALASSAHCNQHLQPNMDAHQYLRREFSQLVSDHVLCYSHVMVDFAIVHLKDQTHEVRQDGRAACLSLDRRCSFSRLRSYYRETFFPLALLVREDDGGLGR